MKLRIKSSSVRFRLTKSEVYRLATEGYIEERAEFPGSTLTYAVHASEKLQQLSANFSAGKILLQVPESFAKEWYLNDVVGMENKISLDDNNSLNLLLEKDFVCLDETTEDQSDNYANPQKTAQL